MKFDDAINGLLAIVLGSSMILLARGMPPVRHIEYGPGFFPTLVGGGLIAAGLVLIIRRIVSAEGYVAGWVTSVPSADPPRKSPLLSLFVIIASVVFYTLWIKSLGFFLTMTIVLFCTIGWFDRRPVRSGFTAIIATWVMHSFFYQLMSVQLPWGLLTPYAGMLTW